MNDLFRHLHVAPEIAVKFIATFSRIEYALKSTGFVNADVSASWDRFANSIDAEFQAISAPDVVAAKTYLLTKPPRKQILLDGRLSFRDQIIDDNQTVTQQVVLMVRVVRNNLFHGGKYCPHGEDEMGRNAALISHSLCILDACVGLNEIVRSSFYH